MNSVLTSIYSGYENVYFVHSDMLCVSKVSDVIACQQDAITAIGADRPIMALFGCPANSLVAIDVDSVGIEKTDYYLFLLTCLFPKVAIVLIANDLPEKVYQRYLASSVVAIIQGAEPTAVASMA